MSLATHKRRPFFPLRQESKISFNADCHSFQWPETALVMFTRGTFPIGKLVVSLSLRKHMYNKYIIALNLS